MIRVASIGHTTRRISRCHRVHALAWSERWIRSYQWGDAFISDLYMLGGMHNCLVGPSVIPIANGQRSSWLRLVHASLTQIEGKINSLYCQRANAIADKRDDEQSKLVCIELPGSLLYAWIRASLSAPSIYIAMTNWKIYKRHLNDNTATERSSSIVGDPL